MFRYAHIPVCISKQKSHLAAALAKMGAARIRGQIVIIGDDDGASVLAAIESADTPVGVDGREDEGAAGELFREIRFQRKSIFRAEQRAAMGEDAADSENWSWDQLGDTAREYLASYSKDLEPMAILIEAAVRLDGPPGLEAAMTLLANLVETYWEQGLYPVEDEEDGVEARFQPLSGLSGGGGDKDGTLIMALRRMPLGSDGGSELRYLDRVTADALLGGSTSGTAEQRSGRNQEAQDALDAADATARRISRRTLQATADRIAASEAAWRRTIAYVSERTKPRFPSASRVSDELRNMREWLDSLIKKLPEDAVEVAEAAADAATGDAPAVAGGAAAAAGGPMVLGKITRRDDALRAITAAADYFDSNEPLSPLGFALREVDRRARMSLDAFLEELIPDSSTRQTFYWRSGIKPPSES